MTKDKKTKNKKQNKTKQNKTKQNKTKQNKTKKKKKNKQKQQNKTKQQNMSGFGAFSELFVKNSLTSLPDLAKYNNKEEIIGRLQRGANVNEQDLDGFTALHRSCLFNNTQLVEILLQNNVNLKVDYDESSSFLFEQSPFWIACNNSYASVSLMLQDARVDINQAENNGLSPLMRACLNGYSKTIVQLLLSYGRNIDILKKSTKDIGDIKSGSTALDIAKQRNNTDIVQLIEQYQSNPKETQKTLRNQLNLKGKI